MDERMFFFGLFCVSRFFWGILWSRYRKILHSKARLPEELAAGGQAASLTGALSPLSRAPAQHHTFDARN
jgi:hypothetical protein